VTDGRTDRRTSCDGIVRAMHTRRAVKIAILDEYMATGSTTAAVRIATVDRAVYRAQTTTHQ